MRLLDKQNTTVILSIRETNGKNLKQTHNTKQMLEILQSLHSFRMTTDWVM
ncbi:MAG: hypothetical protein HOC18_08780 [Candidatus Marinimicrobia bacterium]|nr:hypothetical protein [Candidatus Neomarinimicrobiota bacterium]